jgi:hypothetical protein
LITADRDMVPEDPLHYRVALIDAFRKRGIFALGVTNLSEESLAWPGGADFEDYDDAWLVERLRGVSNWLRYEGNRRDIHGKTRGAGKSLHDLLAAKPEPRLVRFGRVCGLALNGRTAPPEIEPGKHGIPKFEVHQFRTAFRARPDGTLLNDVVLTLTQRRPIRLPGGEGTYDFRGGATLIFDLATMKLRHCIRCPITDEARRAAYEAYMRDQLPASIRKKFFARKTGATAFEPFAFLHTEHWKGDDHA